MDLPAREMIGPRPWNDRVHVIQRSALRQLDLEGSRALSGVHRQASATQTLYLSRQQPQHGSQPCRSIRGLTDLRFPVADSPSQQTLVTKMGGGYGAVLPGRNNPNNNMEELIPAQVGGERKQKRELNLPISGMCGWERLERATLTALYNAQVSPEVVDSAERERDLNGRRAFATRGS